MRYLHLCFLVISLFSLVACDLIKLPDSTAPDITILAPANATTQLPGVIAISGTASDDKGLEAVEISIDGGTATSVNGLNTWNFNWDASSMSLDTHTIVVTARDTSNNESQASISITLSQSSDTPDQINIVNLTATATASSINLDWDVSIDETNVAEYQITRSPSPIQVFNSTSSFYVDTGLESETTYTYEIVAIDEDGNKSTKTTISTSTLALDTTPPNVTILAPANDSTQEPGVIIISGTASDDTSLQAVEISIDGDTATSVTGLDNWSYSWDASSISSDTHTITVFARDAANNVSQANISIILNQSTDNPGMINIVNLSATATASSITLSWDIITDGPSVAGYQITRITSPNQVFDSTSMSYVDTGLESETMYTYEVVAIDGDGNKSAKATISKITLALISDIEAPTAATNLTAAPQASKIKLNWRAATDNIGIAYYQVFRDGVSIGNTSYTSFTDIGLTLDTSYAYKVVAYDSAGNQSPDSELLMVSTSNSNLNFLAYHSVVDLSWANTHADSYEIYRDGVRIASDIKGRFYVDGGLSPDSSYNYEIFEKTGTNPAVAIPETQQTISTTQNSELFSIVVENTSSEPLTNIPVTFGQPFKKGYIQPNDFFRTFINDGTNTEITSVQLDRKATHSDGTLRHGIISFILPALAAHESKTLAFKINHSDTPQTAASVCDLTTVDPSITAILNFTGDGIYSADAVSRVNHASTLQWLEGPVVNEWIIKGDLKKDGTGPVHSDIEVYFHVKCYSTGDIRTDFVVENSIAHQNDQNIDYSWTFTNESGSDVELGELTHYARARFRKTVWSNIVPTINIKHDARHVILSKGVASYDQNSPPSEVTLATIKTKLDESDTNPMGIGNIIANFPSNEEASMDASWSVAYLLSGDSRAYESMMANANAAGSFAVHYRDNKDVSNIYQSTGQHPSVLEHPTIGIHRDSKIKLPTSSGSEREQIGSPDTAHQDSFAYIPYLLTGDYYLLEEVQFWANWNFLGRNPGYRNEFGENYYGLLTRSQIRAVAWGLRELTNAAYITPDDSLDKQYFNDLLNNNINFYHDKHANGAHNNSLGYIASIYPDSSVRYGGSYPGWTDPDDDTLKVKSGIAPWQEHWLGAVFGRINNIEILDNDVALNLVKWKSKFVLGPLTDTAFCPIISTSYNYHVTDNTLSPYSSWSDVYQATIQLGSGYEDYASDLSDCGTESMSSVFDLPAGAIKYSHSETSFYAMMQGAVAAAVDSRVEGADLSWDVFSGSTVTPDYSEGNRYNLVPYDIATFNNHNQPVADPGADLVVVSGSSVVLDGSNSFSRTGDSVSSYFWRALGENAVTLTNANNAKASFTAPAVIDMEVFHFELTVTDSTGSNTQPVTVTVINELTFKDFGGQFYGLMIDNTENIAYVAQGEGGLGIYDISTATDPILIGKYNTEGNAQDVTVVNDIAYVADQHTGLMIIDVSNPASPFLLGSIDTDGRATAVKVRGNYAYLADYNDGFKTINISDPTYPQLSHETNTGGSKRVFGVTLTADGKTAYVADRTTLMVYDLTNAAIPSLTHSVTTTSGTYDIALSDDENTAYVANGAQGLLVFDISNKYIAPVLLDTKTVDTAGNANKVKVDGEMLLLSDGKNGISLFDITDNQSPVLISAFDTLGNAEDVAFFGSDVVVADGTGGLEIVDFSNQVNPVKKSEIITVGYARGICIKEPYAFVADLYNGLVIIDISNPLSPRFAQHFPMQGKVRDIAISGNYAFLANDSEGLRVIDISDINALQEVSITPLSSNPQKASAIKLSGDYAYIAGNFGGLYVIDISDPENPVVTGSNHFGETQSASQSKGVAVKNNIALIANGTFSFALSDVSDPSNPEKTAVMLSDQFDTSVIKGDAHDIDVKGDYAYMAHNGAGLAIIDISTPSEPVLYKEFKSKDIGFRETVNSIYIEGNYLFVNNADVDGPQRSSIGNLAIWDISNPATLTYTPDAFYNLGGKFPAMMISGNYMYLGGEAFKVLDISNRTAPHQ